MSYALLRHACPAGSAPPPLLFLFFGSVRVFRLPGYVSLAALSETQVLWSQCR